MKKTKKQRYGPLYSVWSNMKQRCMCKKNKGYKNYGGRGILVCDRWKNSFDHFLEDVGERPSDLHTIDRINNNGNYEPGNVKWSTMIEQAKNKRKPSGYCRSWTEKDNKVKILQFRVTESESAVIFKKCKNKKMSLSEYLRKKIGLK